MLGKREKPPAGGGADMFSCFLLSSSISLFRFSFPTKGKLLCPRLPILSSLPWTLPGVIT